MFTRKNESQQEFQTCRQQFGIYGALTVSTASSVSVSSKSLSRSMYKPPEGLFSEGRCNGGFRGLILCGAYTWRGLFSEFYGTLCVNCFVDLVHVLTIY